MISSVFNEFLRNIEFSYQNTSNIDFNIIIFTVNNFAVMINYFMNFSGGYTLINIFSL